MIEDGVISLISSTVIEYENSRSPHPLRRAWVDKVTYLAEESQQVNESIRQRAQVLEQGGVKAVDALHLACAEAAQVDYFVTGDDHLFKRCQQLKGTDVKPTICNPTEFVRKIEV